MKILLMGDASNYHRALAIGLAGAGHDVTVASNGSRWMDTARDIDISRRAGRIGGALLWVKLNTLLSRRLSGYDVVQIHNPVFVELKPHRVRRVFDRLRQNNGRVFLTALGNDTPYIDYCVNVSQTDRPPRQSCNREYETGVLQYNEYVVEGKQTVNFGEHLPWLQPLLSDHCRYIYDNIDGVVSALYEYHLACGRVVDPERLAYGGIPIDCRRSMFSPLLLDNRKMNIFVACHKGREAIKGVDVMWPVIQRLVADFPDKVDARLVQNVPFDEFTRLLGRADIVVDQLYSYTPATTALMAMAQGKVVVSGGEEDYYRFIGEENLRPIINPEPTNPDKLYDDIKALIDNPDRLSQLSVDSRAFVEKHNDVDIVAKRFIDFWESKL